MELSAPSTTDDYVEQLRAGHLYAGEKCPPEGGHYAGWSRSGKLCGVVARGSRDTARRKRKRGRHGRKIDAECRAALGPVVAGDLSTLIADHSVANAQAKPRTFSDRLGCVKRVKDQCGIAHPGPGIREKNNLITLFEKGSNRKDATAALLHGIHGIVDNV